MGKYRSGKKTRAQQNAYKILLCIQALPLMIQIVV